ncbi:hypothetical protein EON63_24305 [archaeon]|nr:MAG: hypothetical protein EON63_24305 [archaeon]
MQYDINIHHIQSTLTFSLSAGTCGSRRCRKVRTCPPRRYDPARHARLGGREKYEGSVYYLHTHHAHCHTSCTIHTKHYIITMTKHIPDMMGTR